MLVYNEKIRDYFDNPVNIGVLSACQRVGIGQAGIPGRSSVVKLSLRVDEQGVITEAKFKTYGCGVAIAASAYATQLLLTKSLHQAAKISYKAFIEYFELESKKYHCAMLVEDAIQAAIADVKENLNEIATPERELAK